MTRINEVVNMQVAVERGERVLVPYRGKDTEFIVWRKGVDYVGRSFIDLRLNDMKTASILTQIMNRRKANRFMDTDLAKFLKQEEAMIDPEIMNRANSRKVLELVQFATEKSGLRYELIELGNLWLPSISELFGSHFGNSNDGLCIDKEVKTLTSLPPYEIWTRSFLTKSRGGNVFTAYGCGGYVIKNSYANVQDRRYVLPCMRFFV